MKSSKFRILIEKNIPLWYLIESGENGAFKLRGIIGYFPINIFIWKLQMWFFKIIFHVSQNSPRTLDSTFYNYCVIIFQLIWGFALLFTYVVKLILRSISNTHVWWIKCGILPLSLCCSDVFLHHFENAILNLVFS